MKKNNEKLEQELVIDLPNSQDELLLTSVQLILAEKRTSLTFLSTGIALFALVLTILSALIATSKYYELSDNMHFMVPIYLICVFLVLLGFFIVIRSLIRIRRFDNQILAIKKSHPYLSNIIY